MLRCDIHKHAHPPNLIGLLRARSKRPGDGGSCNYFDEIASSHYSAQARRYWLITAGIYD